MSKLLLAAALILFMTSCCKRAECQEEDIANPVLIQEHEFQELCSYKNWYESSDGKEGYVCFFLTATWCHPCKELKRTLFNENLHTSVVYIDIDKEPGVSRSLLPKGAGIPTLVRCKIKIVDGRPVIVEQVVCTDNRNYSKFIKDTIQLRRKFREENK